MDTAKDRANSNKKYAAFALIGLVGISFLAWFLWPVFFDVAEPEAPPKSKAAATLKTPIVQPSLVTTGFDAPTAIVATNQALDKRLFVAERAGVIRYFDPTKEPKPEVALDITTKVLNDDAEMGLLGLAFHPRFAQNGYLYVNYIDKNQNTVIARYTMSKQSKLADPQSEKILLSQKQPYSNHNGGDLAFGSDGYLYIALGDGGSAGDPENRAQNKGVLFGKILRIDVDTGDPYAIPATNPFVKEAGAKPEIWAYGLRNPWRISFDKESGDLYIADVGQGNTEEIDVHKKLDKTGTNYGWPCFEGNQKFKPASCVESDNYITPAMEYDHLEGRCSISGGYVYRGNENPALSGKYFYGDFCSGQLFYASQVKDKWVQVQAAQTPYGISTFGRGGDGELYFADIKTGSIYKINDINN